MKSSVKSQRKAVSFPKKSIIGGTSSFKVTSGRLIDGKCISKTQLDIDSEEEEEEEDELTGNNIEELINMAKKVGLIDQNRNMSRAVSDKSKDDAQTEVYLYDQIYKEVQSIPIAKVEHIKRLVQKYLDSTLQKMKGLDAVNNLYEKEGTIWITPPMSAFVILNNISDKESMFYPRICVWVPHHHLFKKKQQDNGLMCCTKDCDGKLISEGFTDRYTYRKVMEAADQFYVLTHTYKCSKDESHVFDGCNEKVVSQLHELSQRGYDIYRMLSNYGVSKTLEHIVSVYKRNGMSDTDIIVAVKSLHSEKIKNLQSDYAIALGKSK